MAKHFIAITIALVVSAGLLSVSGCQNDAQKGAGIGALVGAGAGQLIGGDTKSTLIGAGVGAGAGYMVGNERDKKKTQAEMDELRSEMNTVTVNVTNSNGSKSQVKLRKQGTGYVGPRGEFYDHLPTDEELRPVYAF
ncbi:MAG: glycine zipper 2TM domain-containing protein [Sedimentisphaerales bacterium]|nr:glycine zipper 2TM domain-containing protein [Sedimentisphaerales bacterium]